MRSNFWHLGRVLQEEGGERVVAVEEEDREPSLLIPVEAMDAVQGAGLQDQVLEGQEADLFSFMFYYKYGMPDVTLPSEKNKTL